MLTIGVDARSVLCKEPRGEGKSLLRLYAEMLRQQSDLKVWFFGDSKASEFTGTLPPGLCVDAPRSWGHRINGWENISLPWRAWRRGCDVLHCASSGAPRFSAVPVMLTVHDLIPLVFDDGQNSRFKANFARRLDNGLAIARRIVTVSEHTRKDLLARTPQLSTPVDVVHWGGDDLVGDGPLPTPASPPYLLAFGGESRRKNTDYLLDRFIAIAPSFSELRLVLVGVSAAWQRRQLAQRLSETGLADRVTLTAFVSEAELDGLFNGAIAVLYPSLYEGFGLPLLEAIGRGVPVLASDCSSIPEVLGGAPGALPLRPSENVDAILLRLVSDAEFREQWVRRQRTELDRFRWSDVANRTVESLRATM